MNTEKLIQTVAKLVAEGKGILAADESNATCTKRFESYGIDSNEETRRRYREILFTAPDFAKYITGVIMYDETFWQKTSDGKNFTEYLKSVGVLPGIKIDLSTEPIELGSVELVTKGIEDLAERLDKYVQAGAEFTKWRAVIRIDVANNLPSEKCIEENTKRLAQYAKIIQDAGLVPIVEPEVLLEGDHSIDIAAQTITKVMRSLFAHLESEEVFLPGLILKTSMALPGNKNPDEASPTEIAEATVNALLESVLSETGAVVFLSGGQTPVEATAHLDAISEREPLPWPIAFSYSRALQDGVLRIWSGHEENVADAQAELTRRLELNHLADIGQYDLDLEY